MQSVRIAFFVLGGLSWRAVPNTAYTYMQQYPFIAVCAVAALIPLIIGFIWYSKAVFGNTWMRVNRFTDADMKRGNMALIFILTYVFSFLLSFILSAMVIHQMTLFSIVASDKSPEAKQWVMDAMRNYGGNFRTFKHGAFHGTLLSIFFALPILGIPALFERRGWKYVLIHWGYWLVTLALMGGVLCQFIKLDVG